MDPNPYQSPQTPPQAPTPGRQRSRFPLTLIELLVILLAVVGILASLFLPTVHSKPRQRHQQPPAGIERSR